MEEPKKVLQEMQGEVKSEWRNAVQQVRAALSLLPRLMRILADRWEHFAEINLQLAEHYLENDELSDAILRFRFVLWKEPRNVDALSGLGVSLLQSGQREKGTDALKKALGIAPDNARAQAALSTLSPPPVPPVAA